MQPTRPGAQPHALLGTGGLCMLPTGEACTVAQVMTRPRPSTFLACRQNEHPDFLGIAKRPIRASTFCVCMREGFNIKLIRRRVHGHLQVFIATGGGGSKKSRKSQLGGTGEFRTASGTNTCGRKTFVGIETGCYQGYSKATCSIGAPETQTFWLLCSVALQGF